MCSIARALLWTWIMRVLLQKRNVSSFFLYITLSLDPPLYTRTTESDYEDIVYSHSMVTHTLLSLLVTPLIRRHSTLWCIRQSYLIKKYDRRSPWVWGQFKDMLYFKVARLPDQPHTVLRNSLNIAVLLVMFNIK